jgi:hypothetical protein
MRILIAGPPKTGNMWLKCLLAELYGLHWLPPKDQPAAPTPAAFLAWAARGGFPDGAIFHQHYDFSAELCDAADAIPAHLVTIVRDPYDAFVSTHAAFQRPLVPDGRVQRPMAVLAGKDLADPAVVAFLREGGYRNNLVKARDWATGGRALVVRYEALHADPAGELGRLAAAIAPAPADAVARAVEACAAENMRQRSRNLASHVRVAQPGDARARLNDEHRAAFREAYGDLIRGLGYEVR